MYLNELVVSLKTVKNHISHQPQVLTVLRDSRVAFKLYNCSYLSEENCFSSARRLPRKSQNCQHNHVGHQVSEVPSHPNGTPVPSFGLKHAPPLHDKIQPRCCTTHQNLCMNEPTKFQSLTPSEKKSVEQLKSLLKNLTLLALQRAGGHLTIATDSCNARLKSLLLQTNRLNRYSLDDTGQDR